MISLADLTRSLDGLLRLVVPRAVSIDDITLVELDRDVLGVPGDLALGVGVDDIGRAVRLIADLGGRGVGALVLRASCAAEPTVVAAAHTHRVALVELADNASWAHVVWLLRGLLDRSMGQGGVSLIASDELFSIADAAAGLVGGAITIEDSLSRVLAYSSRQESSDPARVSTIVGRRVPDHVISHLRARGVFRRMTASPQPFFLAAAPDSPVGARFVIPVHAGGEWLGSLWALVDEPPAPDTIAELERTAAVVALHLLQLRSQADLARRVAMDRLRQALIGQAVDVDAWLPPGPWRVVALTTKDAAAEHPDVARRLDAWEAIFRRRSWPQPRLVDVADQAFAVIRDDTAAPVTHLKAPPGTWTWLGRVMEQVAADGSPLAVAAGGTAHSASDLPVSLAQAREVGEMVRSGRVSGAAPRIEDAWVALTTQRAAEALRSNDLPTPLDALATSDASHATAYLSTLAAWLDHRGSAGDAAEALGIHPNTLRYRMGNITTILDADLPDPDTRLALRLQLLAVGH